MTDVRTETVTTEPEAAPASSRLTAEQIVVGSVTDLGTYTVTEADVVSFAEQWDPQDFHTDREVAEQGHFGGLIGSGIHTMAIFQRLSVLGVYNDWQVIAGRRISDIELSAPLRPGDTVRGTLTIDDVRIRRGVGAVDLTGTLHNQDGVQLFTLHMEVYVRAQQNG